VGARRPITEEDVRRTEAQIARSYGRLKRSMARAPSQALGRISGTAREHPVGTAVAAVAAGIAMYGMVRLMTRPKARSSGDPRYGEDVTLDLLRMLVPLATPYIAGYLERYAGRMFTRESR